jgi:hypothetical protein
MILRGEARRLAVSILHSCRYGAVRRPERTRSVRIKIRRTDRTHPNCEPKIALEVKGV